MIVSQPCEPLVYTHTYTILAGGFMDPTQVMSSKGGIVDHLISTQEEADTRMVLHMQDAKEIEYQKVEMAADQNF